MSIFCNAYGKSLRDPMLKYEIYSFHKHTQKEFVLNGSFPAL